MKYYIKFFTFLSLFLIFNSCKKDLIKFQKEEETHLPNFGNVRLEKVFDRKDGKLEEEDSVEVFLNQYYQRIWEQGDLWGGILIAKGDNILYENYRGFSDANHQKAISRSTPLHIASISKPLTAMVVMKLVEAGKINLENEVSHYLPKFPYAGVTVKTLLNHRSGLPKYEHFIEKISPRPKELAKEFLTNQDILNLMIQHQPPVVKEADSGFMYCNTNYALLALIVEKVTGEHFPEAMRQMVFKPLKMNDTYVFQEKDIATATKTFYNRGAKLYPLDRLDLIYGDKNIYTTPRDLLNFSRAMYSKDFLRKDLMEQVFTPYSNEKSGINNYGLGFRMKIFDEKNKLIYHNGWWHGTNSVFAHLLKSNVTIVAIGNKFSQKVYSALSLSALFEDFPYESERLYKSIDATNPADSTKVFEE